LEILVANKYIYICYIQILKATATNSLALRIYTCGLKNTILTNQQQ
jgi:hypothetical protein